jgi:hypothetical protein
VDGSEETVLTPEAQQERLQAAAKARIAVHRVRYNLA